jgi:hypothetical protein
MKMFIFKKKILDISNDIKIELKNFFLKIAYNDARLYLRTVPKGIQPEGRPH